MSHVVDFFTGRYGSGGVIASISILALFHFYFSDWKTWLLAVIIAAIGLVTQIRVYDLNSRPQKPKHAKKKTAPKPQSKH